MIVIVIVMMMMIAIEVETFKVQTLMINGKTLLIITFES